MYSEEIFCPLALFLLAQWADSNLNQAKFSLPEAGGQVLIFVTGLLELIARASRYYRLTSPQHQVPFGGGLGSW